MTATKVKMVAKARIMMYYRKILKKMGILIIQVNNSTKVITQALESCVLLKMSPHQKQDLSTTMKAMAFNQFVERILEG